MTVIARQEGRAGRITLARPEALNALTLDMIRDIDRVLKLWSGDAHIRLVIIDAMGSRAFSAGADIAEAYHTGRQGDFDAGRTFLREEYIVDARVACFPKPVVAFMQGYAMGGGVGLGGHALHRVVGDSTRIAMPECMIGLVPDAGGTHLLAQAPGHLGEYLGLTGHRMEPGDAIFAGFADHYIPEARWPELIREAADSGDPACIEAAAAPVPPAPLAERREVIDRAFAAPDVAAILASLPDDDWGRTVRETLERQCPLSMAAALRLIREARAHPGVPEALAREYRFTWRAASDGEFLEGIRAAVIDKDRKPRWRDSIATLDPAQVDAMLAPLGEDELRFPDLQPTRPPLPSGG